MWVVTTQGFYSVVAHRDDPDRVLVRARTREDIEALRGQIPDLEPFEDPDADYRWRAVVERSAWARALAELGEAIDYDNFKSAVGDRQGRERARLYGRIWGELLSLQSFGEADRAGRRRRSGAESNFRFAIRRKYWIRLSVRFACPRPTQRV